jgi:hypothetical protein
MTTSPIEDDDSLLEKVDQVFDDVLAEDMAPPEPMDPWERRQHMLDSWTAIILALAAVATAWASFQASQWSGTQSDAQSASSTARSDAGRAASEATGDEIVDSQMWLSWLNATASKQTARAHFYEDRFSPTLASAQKQWLAGAQLNANGDAVVIPQGTPMDLPIYVVPNEATSRVLAAQAEAKLTEADQASGYSTQFVLLAVLFALVLFFASVATKFAAPRIQALLILLSIALLLFALARMLMLPQSI